MATTWAEEYDKLLRRVQAIYDSDTAGIDEWTKLNKPEVYAQYHTEYEAVSSVPNAVITKSRSGQTLGTDILMQAPREFNPPAVIDSNVPNYTYGNGINLNTNDGYRINGSGGGTSPNVFSSGAKSVSTGSKVLTTVGTVSLAFGAAQLGTKLGKAINSNFGGQYAWNEQDWEDWVSGKDSLDQAVFRTLFDIDGTAYLPEETLGAMYKMLHEMGAYDLGDEVIELPEGVPTSGSGAITNMPIPFTRYFTPIPMDYIGGASGTWWLTISDNAQTVYIISLQSAGSSNYVPFCFSKGPFKRSFNTRQGAYPTSASTTTYNGQTFYYSTPGATISPEVAVAKYPKINSTDSSYQHFEKIGYSILYGTIATGGVEGIEDEDSDRASTQVDPTLITGNNPHDITNSLKQNYPQLFDGSITEKVPQEDGTTKEITYIPVPWVDIDPNGNPVTGVPSQNDPQVDPDTATTDMLKDIIDKLTDFLTNPPGTGTGDTPPAVMPVGSASSLWKIYNPTQAQVDAFGSWLWNSNIFEQIKKLFNDPMQAIIGIHKVFATPSIGGTATIKVGYLDSEVPSDWVDNQYTTIDCGTVNLREYFGNVFDYAPYTRVSLYLPFIGIVDLDVADVMRASIKVKYHVDVLTGACLADVIVNRDASGGVLYQYSGSAIVTYPISSGNYMGMVAGVLSVASGIAGTILSGGALAPALIGGAVGMSHLHTDVGKSGSFSGCAGAMGAKKPYLIISRPQTRVANNFEHFTGLPANSHVTLSNCAGFTKVKSVYIKTSKKSTEEERAMIASKLKEGVLI